MFKKTWKQIKILLILIVILICMPYSTLSARTGSTGKDDLQYYIKLNESEQRLIGFKDDNEALKLKITQLEIINISRKKYGAPPVRLDIMASRVANKMAKEAGDNEYLGHWNMAGEEPYLRYAFAGGYDHISENAYGEWSTGDYNTSPQTIGSMMKNGHGKFMSERAPNDGHKENIIEKSHNFVGIGFSLSGKQFRYYEEFIDRYLEFENIPSELSIGKQASITVKTDGKNFLYYLIIYREKPPMPLTPSEISKRGSYRDYTSEEYKEIVAWDLASFRKENTYRIPISFSQDGLYYIQIYTNSKEITKPTSLNTKGKTPESGIVIRVNR